MNYDHDLIKNELWRLRNRLINVKKNYIYPQIRPIWLFHIVDFFLFLTFIYSKVNVTEKKREVGCLPSIDSLLIWFQHVGMGQNDLSSQELQPKLQNERQGYKQLRNYPWFSRYIYRKLDQNCSSWNSRWCSGMRC